MPTCRKLWYYCRVSMLIPPSMILKCLRCGHQWIRRIPGRPKKCAACDSPYWDTKPGELPMGRPRKKAGKKKG